MAEKLINQNLPPGAIIDAPQLGVRLRNDGLELQPANENPWYVLATVHGEIEGALWETENMERAAQNRRIWNGWACQGMSKEDRENLAQKLGLETAELADLNADEQSLLEQAFKDRLGVDAIVPMSEERVDFRKMHFVNTFVFTKCIVAGVAYFESASFSGGAYFDSATFSGVASFGSATFSGDAYFGSATFSGFADFGSATFSYVAYFSSAGFESATRFDAARFLSAVPQFHAAKLYDDTTFSLPGDYLQYWPPLGGTIDVKGRQEPVVVMPAAEQKRAYNRLRLFYNKTLQVKEEQFFHNREMTCEREMAGGLMRLVYGGYAVVSDYGYSVVRPVAGLGMVIAAGWFVLVLSLARGEMTVNGLGLQALGLSVANTFSFLGFGRLFFGGEFYQKLPVVLQTLSGTQTVLGFILLFFLGLGLRNRFRLR